MRRSHGGLVVFALLVAACSPAPALRDANLVLVVVDALRADHLGLYGYDGEPPTSPFIDSWARDGVWFEDLISTASQTVPSMLSVFTAEYPRDHGNQYYPRTRSFRAPELRMLPRVEASQTLLAEVLRGAGFRTAAIVTNPWLKPKYGFSQGFDSYQRAAAYFRGSHVNQLAGRFLADASSERFFLYLHYMDVHSPYVPPPAYHEAFVGGYPGRDVFRNGPVPGARAADVEHTRRKYAAGVRGFDDVFRDLLGMLDAAGVTDSTLVVLLADHGEEFHEHGGMGHGSTLFEEVLHVPWVLVHPELRSRAGPLAVPASGVDVAPTLLELLGVGEAFDGSGRSLARGVRGEEEPPEMARFAELGKLKAIQVGEHKVVAAIDGEDFRAYDLAADAGEGGTAPPSAAWVQPLVARLSGWLAEGRPPEVVESEAPKYDAELERQLRELGYVAEPEREPEPALPGDGGS